MVGTRLLDGRMLAPVNTVGEAVIHALEADDFFTAGEGSREPQSVEDRLRAGIAQAHLLDARDGGDDFPRQGRLRLRRQRKYRAAPLNLLDHGRRHFRRTVSENHRSETEQVVDVFVAVDIV